MFMLSPTAVVSDVTGMAKTLLRQVHSRRYFDQHVLFEMSSYN